MFAGAKAAASARTSPPKSPWRYDAFISYAREDREAVDCLVSDLLRARPGTRIFIDRLELRPGSPWQQHLFEAIDECNKVIPVLSPDYLASKVCKEELNIAIYRHRESEEGVMLPVYLRSTGLPTYMKLAQWMDCRESERAKINRAAGEIARQL